MRTFRSDNNAALCPEALRAIIDANEGGHVTGYGDDEWTARAVRAFRSLFGAETSVFLVATGTAANTLAVASLTEPWEQVVCHHHSHYNDDESTAPERLTHCRCHPIRTDATKLTPADIELAASGQRGDVHQPQPGVVTVSNTTELGTVYTPAEMRALCEAAHAHGFRVHVDGARFANAVAALDCDPRALTVDAGVDALSFGGTKNGLAFGEAVLFFPQGDGAAHARATYAFPFHRKGTGHLLSKHRFVAAPFAATLADDVWRRHASHANAMAARLASGLESRGLVPRVPVEANAVFVALPASVDAALRAGGHGYYPFGDAAWGVSRLMCSFDTSVADVDGLLADVSSAG
ncbi:MAG: aminotransferase class I/II-fold pyridoxal phosphate-dependent enzyme [Phycisphaerales bacterium]|nr:aminotransferase class I/II-fold pyridoxal phosphate-dependent enzyme [Phycisphaerales bacterium]